MRDSMDPKANPFRNVSVKYENSSQCPKCSKFAMVVIEVDSNIPNDPHEGIVGKKCLWCGGMEPK